MACCGDKRARLNTLAGVRDQRANAAAPVRPSAPPRPVPATGAAVPLQYLGHDALSLRGPRTGRIYHLSDAGAEVTVHPDDAPALLRTGLFVLAESSQ